MPVTWNSILQVTIFLIIILLLTKPVGLYLYKVLQRGAHLALASLCARGTLLLSALRD